ncbi:hypothetical protein NHX12_005980 [Muraenolepis orangiensis]|uniref:SS18 N-terminal domain-containing protein n=1 Tax=Muraenolepis orangiensis TaxID=630683 RepID=A0A9Q0DSF7_9TELE|nr:hypothetical protein NHX12_005980 [Muraenolepis orangiensis]
MSVVFVPKRLRGSAAINQDTIQRLLEENAQLIRCITQYQQKGRAVESVQYQQILHRNIVYLATIADARPDIPTASLNSTYGEAPSTPPAAHQGAPH